MKKIAVLMFVFLAWLSACSLNPQQPLVTEMVAEAPTAVATLAATEEPATDVPVVLVPTLVPATPGPTPTFDESREVVGGFSFLDLPKGQGFGYWDAKEKKWHSVKPTWNKKKHTFDLDGKFSIQETSVGEWAIYYEKEIFPVVWLKLRGERLDVSTLGWRVLGFDRTLIIP